MKALVRDLPKEHENQYSIGVHLQNAVQLLELLASSPDSKTGQRWMFVRDLVSEIIKEYISGKRNMISNETGRKVNMPPLVPVDAPPPAPVPVDAPPPAPVPVNVPPPAPSSSQQEIEERARAQARKRRLDDIEIEEREFALQERKEEREFAKKGRELAIKERELAIAERSLKLAGHGYVRLD